MPALAVATLVAASGCFTNPINRPPVITQLNQAGNSKGQPATFMAVGSDPDQDQLTWTWNKKTGTCPDAADASAWPHDDTMTGEPDAPATFVVSDPTYTKSAVYCVWAFATDRYGSVAARNRVAIPDDNPPLATIQMVVDPGAAPPPGPMFPAYSTFQLTAVASDPDDDPLTYTWTLQQRPPGSSAELGPCVDGDSLDQPDVLRCFTADLSGTYVVSLMVGDGTRTVQATTPMLVVLGDAPPCIQSTVPTFTPGVTTQRAATTPGSVPNPGPVSVDYVYDDGKLYSTVEDSTRFQFTWYTSTDNDPLRYVDNVNFFQLTLPDARLYDYVNVRLEVSDPANAGFIDSVLASCGDADFCAAPVIPQGRVDCWLRVTWRFHLDK